MTEPLTPAPVSPDGRAAESTSVASSVAGQLRSRVVREARRETWFLVNEGTTDVDTLPIELRSDASLRRVDVNGEVAEFSEVDGQVLVRPRRILRAGSGTLVVLHFR